MAQPLHIDSRLFCSAGSLMKHSFGYVYASDLISPVGKFNAMSSDTATYVEHRCARLKGHYFYYEVNLSAGVAGERLVHVIGRIDVEEAFPFTGRIVLRQSYSSSRYLYPVCSVCAGLFLHRPDDVDTVVPRAIRDSPELDEHLAEATGRFEWCIAVEVLLEYEVKLDRKSIRTRTLGISAARFDWASARCAWDASWPPSYVPGIISQAFADDPKYCWRLRAAVHRRRRPEAAAASGSVTSIA